MSDQALQRARDELEAIAILIERPPLDDVTLEQSAALRLSRAIRTVLATPVTVTAEAVREACHHYGMLDREIETTVAVLRHLHLIGDGSGWVRQITEAEWDAQIGHPTEDIAFYWTEKARLAARTLGLFGNSSGWARRLTEAEWRECWPDIAARIHPSAERWQIAKDTLYLLGFIAPDPDPLGPVKAAHPDIDPAVVESIAKMVGEKAS